MCEQLRGVLMKDTSGTGGISARVNAPYKGSTCRDFVRILVHGLPGCI